MLSAARLDGRLFVVSSTSDSIESFKDTPPYERLESLPPPRRRMDCLGRTSRVAWAPTDVVACAASHRLYISDARTRFVDRI